MRKEFKYGVVGLVAGFLFFFALLALVMNVSASEVPEVSEVIEDTSVSQIEQDAQTELAAAAASETEPEQNTADEPPQESEIAFDVVQDEQIDLSSMIPESQRDILDGMARDFQIEPFASGVIIGELADLLQENVIENDGYTEESWQRYENAVADGWTAIGNFMTYTNDEVRVVIDELKAAIAGLEYPANHPSTPGGLTAFDSDYMSASLISAGMVTGSVFGMSFVSKWGVGV